MPKYDVLDEATIDADVSTVFSAILDVNNYFKWWMPHLEGKIRGDEKIVREGSLYDIKVHHRYGTTKFTIKAVEIVKEKAIKTEYIEGDFLGEAEWSFKSLNGKTKVGYRWKVRSNKFLISLLSPFINVPKMHSKVMQAGFKGLNEYLTKERLGVR